MSLEIGNKAPDFSLPAITGGITGGGQPVQLGLKDYAGRRLILYFYPKDDTPGCTTQAIEFSAHSDAFKQANTAILGISADTIAKHEKFRAKHDLTIALASDESQKVLKAYGVWVEKNMYGRKYMGIERTTYLIDAQGAIVQIWRKVKVKDHVSAVLAVVKGS